MKSKLVQMELVLESGRDLHFTRTSPWATAREATRACTTRALALGEINNPRARVKLIMIHRRGRQTHETPTGIIANGGAAAMKIKVFTGSG